VERKRLFGLAPEQRSRPEDEATLYSSTMSAQTFSRLEQLATLILDAGFPVIVDGTFLHRRVREDFRRLAERRGAPFVILDCTATMVDIRSRLQARQQSGSDASEADMRVMEAQLAQVEPFGDAEQPRVVVDSAWDRQRLWHCVQNVLG
jgi:predicted kinase